MMKNGIKSAAMAAVLATSGMVSNAFGLASLPFIEDFASGNANWATSTPAVFANWLGSGGVDGGGYISANATVTLSGFGFITFRGNDANNASSDAFVGNWISGGVTSLSAYVRHNAPMNLNIYSRLDAGSGQAGSSVDFSVAPNIWTQISIPIVDSPSSFQSYGAAGPGGFTTVFSGIQNVQFALSASQDASLSGQVYTLDLDRISVVPEPGPIGLAAGAGLLLIGLRVFRNRKR